MKSSHLFAMLLLLLTTLCSCAEKPTADTLTAAQYGPYPTEYREIVQSYYDGFLSDFASARFEWLEPPYVGNIFYS